MNCNERTLLMQFLQRYDNEIDAGYRAYDIHYAMINSKDIQDNKKGTQLNID